MSIAIWNESRMTFSSPLSNNIQKERAYSEMRNNSSRIQSIILYNMKIRNNNLLG